MTGPFLAPCTWAGYRNHDSSESAALINPILPLSMTAKQRETKNDSAVCNPHSDSMTSHG